MCVKHKCLKYQGVLETFMLHMNVSSVQNLSDTTSEKGVFHSVCKAKFHNRMVMGSYGILFFVLSGLG